ncbi:MAG TPA: hypothetical protein PKA41_00305 [Verrucomicrobiota bacterium]|nr:hypothetical protein [Verrucomicrobiota bacterium]
MYAVKKIRLVNLAAGFALSCLTGCSTVGPDKPQILNAKRLPSFDYTVTTSSNYYLTVYNDAGMNRAQVRNSILNDLMAVVDFNYHEYELVLRDDKTLKDIGVDLATLGLTAAATASGAQQTKTILSAIATGVIGANASIDKHAFQNNTIQALQLQMRAMRAEKEKLLLQGMAKPDAAYPLQSGIRDIIAYYYAGTITDALTGLVSQTGSEAISKKDEADKARKALQ